MSKPLIIEVPRSWFDKYTIPCDFGRPLRPEQIVIEDTEMHADAICIVGWVVWCDRPARAEQLIVGTVIRQRINGQIEELCSHGHIYIKNLPGRKISSTKSFEGPFDVRVVD